MPPDACVSDLSPIESPLLDTTVRFSNSAVIVDPAGVVVVVVEDVVVVGDVVVVEDVVTSGGAALDAVRDGDPFFQLGLANYELLQWNPVIGREGLDAIG